MSEVLTLPVLEQLVPGGVHYGINLVVEFGSDSLWYETSLTIAVHALRNGIRTDYHTFQHIPSEIREALRRLGLNVEKLEEEGTFRILDTYSVTVGLGVSEKPPMTTWKGWEGSVKLSDWSIGMAQQMKAGPSEGEKRRLHIDDNTSVLNRYNKENEITDFWRTRAIPSARARELVLLHSLVAGVYSDAFYRQFESLCDGIIDFKSEEKDDRQIEHFVRVRMMRGGGTYDSRWRKLRLLNNGEVALAE